MIIALRVFFFGRMFAENIFFSLLCVSILAKVKKEKDHLPIETLYS